MPVAYDYSHELGLSTSTSGDPEIDRQWSQLQSEGATGYAPGLASSVANTPDFSHELGATQTTQDFTDELHVGSAEANRQTLTPIQKSVYETQLEKNRTARMPDWLAKPGAALEQGFQSAAGAVGGVLGGVMRQPLVKDKPEGWTVGDVLNTPNQLTLGILSGKPGQRVPAEQFAIDRSGGPEAWAALTPEQRMTRTIAAGFIDPTLVIGGIPGLLRGLKGLSATMPAAKVEALTRDVATARQEMQRVPALAPESNAIPRTATETPTTPSSMAASEGLATKPPSTLDLAARYQEGLADAAWVNTQRKLLEDAGLPVPKALDEAAQAANAKLASPQAKASLKEGFTAASEDHPAIAPVGGASQGTSISPREAEAAFKEAMKASGILEKDIPPGLLAQLRQDPAQVLESSRTLWPAEQRFWRNAPQSNAVAAVDRHDVTAATTLGKVLEQPWAKERQIMPTAKVIDAEAEAVRIWKAGGKTPASLEQAISSMPAHLQEEIRYRNSRIPIEQDARRRLGLPELPTVPSPYLPRLSVQEAEAVLEAERRGQVTSTLETGTKTFAKPRYFDTMKAGQAAGIKYEDPYKAFLMREVYSAKLEATANMMDELKGKVLFNTPGEAQAVGKKGQAFVIDGLPGGKRYYVPSKDEALFLKQNLLNSKERSGALLGKAAQWSNTAFRNPTLFNPIPHVTKNMGYKYGLSGGQYSKMIQNGRAVFNDPALAARFDKVMPFEATGETTNSLVTKALQDRAIASARLPGATGTDIAKGYGAGLLKTVAKTNEPSSKFIFATADPFMKAARWKQYIDAGMTDQAAANHVTVDLIRYSARSDMVDIWKSIPLNFFVQWRLGSLGATLKAMSRESAFGGSHPWAFAKAIGLKAGTGMAYPVLRPVRTILFVSALQQLRDGYERLTGDTFHMPIDYLTQPIHKLAGDILTKGLNAALPADAQAPVDNFSWAQKAAEVIGTGMFGPGSGGTVSRFNQVLKVLQGKAGWDDVKRIFWSIAQTADAGTGAVESWNKFQRDGNADHLVDILKTVGGQLTLGAHPVYEPPARKGSRPSPRR